MKNVQVVDGAENAVYDIFEIGDDDFAELFPEGQDVTFIEDLEERVPKDRLSAIFEAMWARRVRKIDAMGIHGLIFVGLPQKRQYYPSRRDEAAINPDGTRLR